MVEGLERAVRAAEAMRKPIYSDMDNVLVAPIIEHGTNDAVDLIVRPGVDEFLGNLSRYGDLCLLTAASAVWAKKVLKRIGPSARLFKDVVTREDMVPISKQIEIVEKSPGLTDTDREDLYREIKPMLPPGVIFDDYPVGSWMYRLKGFATGIVYLNPSLWVQVEEFNQDGVDDGGLEKAYLEFKKRNAAWRTRPVIGSSNIVPVSA
jgi:hypothetical protein